jgi:hypothetical protein
MRTSWGPITSSRSIGKSRSDRLRTSSRTKAFIVFLSTKVDPDMTPTAYNDNKRSAPLLWLFAKACP